ncbi:HTH-type transcriptional regulator LutR [Planococcus massiliensis]|uniref:HTH-type transcriptional regulator LutR n=1 Tax=Planococcus massiliensis TaxID=1499687 RepID=A0A098ELV6_9BACL|nr:FadR/GntR family transcriptional regulator [Planococcus massiliensis]CEG22765.1 HTH-type transcriptional regulator LutR [Planococcus massiliensis]
MVSGKKKTSQIIAEKIEEFFLNGDLHPGSRLPSERELAGRFGVSRSSVREALQQLELAGAIVIRQGGGSYINTIEVRKVSRLLSDSIVEAESHLVQDMLELRRALEIEAISLAAVRAIPSDLANIKQALDEMKNALYDAEKGIKADLHFHQRIVEASHNPLLIHLVQSLAEKMEDSIRATRTHRFMDVDRYEDTYVEHVELFEAISIRNSALAKERMEKHITRILDELDLPDFPLPAQPDNVG